MSIEATWGELVNWLQKNVSEELGLRPPAMEADLKAFERGTGFRLPEDLRRVYLINNGQKSYTLPGIFMGITFISSNEALETWQGWARNAPYPSEFDEEHSAYPPAAVKTGYFRRARLPFAHDYGNNFIGIDLDPSLAGTVGQVITYGRDELVTYRVAESLSCFLEWLLNEYKNGNYRLLKHEDGGTQIVPAVPKVEHFLDAVPTLFGPPSV